MILIVVLDDRNGMMFNHRRQSQDRLLRKKMMEIAAPGCLWMKAYSYGQFREDEPICSLRVDEQFLEKADQGEYAFVEDADVRPYLDRIEQIVIFRWNRAYPGDRFFDLSVEEEWHRIRTEDFAGSSHDEITMEVYER